MESYRQAVQEQVSRFLLSCRRYKKTLFPLSLIIVGSIMWGSYHQQTDEEHHLPSVSSEPARGMSAQDTHNNVERNEPKGIVIYDISSSLRPHPWREVVSGDTHLLDAMLPLDARLETLEEDDLSANQSLQSDSKGGNITKLGKIERSQGRTARPIKERSNKGRLRGQINVIQETGQTDVIQDSGQSAALQDSGLNKNRQIRLLGIIQGPTPYAIVSIGQNSKTMKIGETWHTVHLISIEDNGMYIEKGGTRTWIGLEG